MLFTPRQIYKPAPILLIIWFSLSLSAVLVGISAVNSVLTSLSQAQTNAPIIQTMQNTGLSLAFSVYLFSVTNCIAVTNYWVISKKYNMAVCKAFGWSNLKLISAVVKEISLILLISLLISVVLITGFSKLTGGIISVTFTPFFICGTLLLMLFTLALSAAIPVLRILQIRPAEVIS